MSYIDHLLLLERIHYHIEHKSTGASGKFAQRLGISERKLFRILAELKDRGAEIKYNADRGTYFYENEVNIHIKIRITHLDTKRTKGGIFSNNTDLLPFLAVNPYKLVLESHNSI